MRPKNEETKNRVYEFINEYIKSNRVSPTVREIANGVNCAVSTAYKFMVRLQDEGLIDIAGRRHIVSSVNSWAMGYAPILGLVACGKPQSAMQDIQGYLPINMEYFGTGEYFALVAEGDSMINVGIDPGIWFLYEGKTVAKMVKLPLCRLRITKIALNVPPH